MDKVVVLLILAMEIPMPSTTYYSGPTKTLEVLGGTPALY